LTDRPRTRTSGNRWRGSPRGIRPVHRQPTRRTPRQCPARSPSRQQGSNTLDLPQFVCGRVRAGRSRRFRNRTLTNVVAAFNCLQNPAGRSLGRAVLADFRVWPIRISSAGTIIPTRITRNDLLVLNIYCILDSPPNVRHRRLSISGNAEGFSMVCVRSDLLHLCSRVFAAAPVWGLTNR
jgi:hypothetical protein